MERVYWSSQGAKTANGCDGADDLTWYTGPGEHKLEAYTGVNNSPIRRAEGVVYYP
ncbi:hypothetical protein [Actinokineospora terrae]|uniref:hypothetical protein n=1 Tax=Actinokineospora terrae TaxID=155974 RepID=UPI0015A5A0DC|nr:hypothetical protein [Actinokineospora terrae]